MSVNKVILLGTLGRDPEVKQAGGSSVCAFSMATNERWNDKNDKSGQKQERTEWHRVVVWGKLADLCGEYLAKGDKAYVEGRIESRKYQDKQGVEKTVVEIVAQSVQFLGQKGGAKPARQERDSGDDFGAEVPS